MSRPPRPLALAALVALSTLAHPGDSEPAASTPPAPAERAPRPPAALAAPAASAAPAGPAAARLDASKARARLDKLAADVERWGGRVGALAIDVSTGAVLAARDEHGLYNPASNAKILTAAGALRALGPQYRYLTGLYGAPSGDAVPELVLRGTGDPSLQTRDLWEMARDLRAAGIRKVGAIAVDQSFFDDQYVPPAFEQQPDEWAAFRAPVAAVSLNANTVLFTVRPAKSGEPASVSIDPPGLVELAGAVATADEGTPEKISLHLEPRGQRLAARLGGNLPEDSRLVRLAKRVDDPRLLAAYALRQILEDTGVQVTGELRLGGQRQKRLLVAHRSAPLGALLHALGKDSDNFYAETVLKTLAAEKRGRPGTSAAGAELIAEMLRDLGAHEDGIVIRNGSGLFDANRTSPWSLVQVLRAGLQDPALGADYVAQLAIGGVDGTLRGRLRGWARRRAIRAKTGTLASVSALSGYILPPPGGSPIAFAILVDGAAGKLDGARKGTDAIVDALARELWRESPTPASAEPRPAR